MGSGWHGGNSFAFTGLHFDDASGNQCTGTIELLRNKGIAERIADGLVAFLEVLGKRGVLQRFVSLHRRIAAVAEILREHRNLLYGYRLMCEGRLEELRRRTLKKIERNAPVVVGRRCVDARQERLPSDARSRMGRLKFDLLRFT